MASMLEQYVGEDNIDIQTTSHNQRLSVSGLLQAFSDVPHQDYRQYPTTIEETKIQVAAVQHSRGRE